MAGGQQQPGHSHRPSLKQTNKSFKSKHSSKGSLKDAAKGRVPTASESQLKKGRKQHSEASINIAHTKAARRNTAKQIQAQKRAAIVEKNRLTKGTEAKAPRIVAVLQLCNDMNNKDVVQELLKGGSLLSGLDRIGQIQQVELSNPRATLHFLIPPYGNLVANLDAASVADFVVLSLSGATEVDSWGETCLRSLAALGVGEGAIRGVVSALPENAVASTQVRKSLQSFLRHFFPSLERVHASSVASEASNLLRSLGDRLPRGVTWRESRARMVAEDVEWSEQLLAHMHEVDEPVASTSRLGVLAVSGVIRGSTLSANRLVHLQGYGDFEVAKIVSAPCEGRTKKHTINASSDVAMGEQVLSEPTPSEADDLVSTNVPSEGDALLAEQTWPTEDEIASAPANVHRTFGTEVRIPAHPLPSNDPQKRLKRVPKGTSAYQAAWIPDEEEEDSSLGEEDINSEEGETHMHVNENNRLVNIEALVGDENEEWENIDPDGSDSQVPTESSAAGMTETRTHRDLPAEVESAQCKQYLASRKSDGAERLREAKIDLEFPDEVDTPLDVPARERFARYRSLKSFRTSTWDPYENLPREYGRCFMFYDWKGMGRRLAKRAAEDGIEPGERVTVYLKNVPQSVVILHTALHPLMLFGLLKHEHKYSVVNFTTTRNTEYTADIKSKDPLILQLGCRRFDVNPIWSQHTQGNGGKGSNNVHKFERYLRHGPNSSVGTAYLPITFGSNVPALLFQCRAVSPGQSNELGESNAVEKSLSSEVIYDLVGTGTLLGVDPTRIVAKRIILTGHPYKVHKKTATIRYLFFNQPDVEYFKPVELRTKKGRTGHIKESLGTHGYLKAGFDGPIDQMDTICLSLYKRCFPKWGTSWRATSASEQQVFDTEETRDVLMRQEAL